MTALHRKLIRDLLAIKGQVLAICLVIACGVATFVMSLSTLYSLEQTKEMYYNRYRFADVFAHVKRAPLNVVERIEQIPGVAQVQARLVFQVTLDVPNVREPAQGRLISIPEHRSPILNDVHLRKGRYIEAGRDDEVLVSEPFAEAHQLGPGDHVVALLNGKRKRLKIVGVVLSPEYIIQIPAGNLLPDDRRFGVFWMSYEQLAAAYDMDGSFNDVTLTMMRGASEKDIIQQLDSLTERYGGGGASGRYEQVSHHYVTEEIKQLQSMGLVAPTIFLAVGAFLLNVVLTRMISLQREEIAALKAFGYHRWEIGLHYLKLVSVIALLGLVLGILGGVWLGANLTRLYTTFYRFPVFTYQLQPFVVAIVVVLCLASGILATFSSVRRAVNLPAAEAMRPEAPGTFRRSMIERVGLGGWLPQTVRMIIRQLERHPVKSLLTSVGISMAVAVLVLGSFGEDAIRFMINFQFNQAQRQDLTLTLVEPGSGRALHDMEHLPGVTRTEPFRSVPIRIRYGSVSRRVGIMGLRDENQLYRLLDTEGRTVCLPKEGLMLSSKLAQLLRVQVGDRVTVEILEGQREKHEILVTGTITEYSGLNAYMELDALRRLLKEGHSISGAFLEVDENRLDELYAELKETPRLAGVTIKSAAISSFEKTIAENLMMMRTVNVVLSIVIAFGVVYNSARISLSERSRDLATLRVMGFTRGEISALLLGELGLLVLLAIPLGLTIGYGLAWITTLGLDTEIYRIPLVINRASFAFAALIAVLATLCSGLVVRQKLDHLDLVSVLKSKE